MQGRTVNSAHILVTILKTSRLGPLHMAEIRGTSNVIAGELGALVPGIPGQQNFLSSVFVIAH